MFLRVKIGAQNPKVFLLGFLTRLIQLSALAMGTREAVGADPTREIEAGPHQEVISLCCVR